MFKKIGVSLLTACLTLGMLSGCTDRKNNEENKQDRLSVVSTIFPEYDWVKQIAGKNAEDMDLTFLLDNGVDLHNYQPTAEDIVKISECDLFIYVGGESDGWVDDVLTSASNKNMQVLNLLDVLGESVKEEEVIEGMQPDEHEEGEESSGSEEEEPEYDEHVWLSLKNTKKICEAISNSLAILDKDHAETYKTNTEAYTEKLDALDKEYQSTVDNAVRKTILVGDRFPFRYMADDYGLEYYAAFVGCSAETEASFDTIVFLAGKVDSIALPAVLAIDGSDQSIAKAVIGNTTDKNQKVLVLNSMQSVTSTDVQKGATYLSAMEENLKVLKEALN